MYLDNSRIFQIFVLIAVSIFIIVIFVGVNFYRTYKNSKTLDENQEINLLYLAKNQSNISKLNNYVMEEDELIYKRLEPKINRNKKAISDGKDDFNELETQIASNKKTIKDNSDNIKLNTDNITSQKDILSNYKIDQADIIKKIKDDQKVIQSNIATFTYDDFKNIRDRLQDSESNIGNIRAHIVDINVEKIPLLEGRVKDNASNISRIDTELEDLDAQFAPINLQLASFSNDVLNKLNSDSILSRLNDVDYRSKQNRVRTLTNSDKFANYMTTKDMDKYYVKRKDHNEWLDTNYKPLHDDVKIINKNYVTEKDINDKFATITYVADKYQQKGEGWDSYLTHRTANHNFMSREELRSVFVEQEDQKEDPEYVSREYLGPLEYDKTYDYPKYNNSDDNLYNYCQTMVRLGRCDDPLIAKVCNDECA
jgi:hypothetical protein